MFLKHIVLSEANHVKFSAKPWATMQRVSSLKIKVVTSILPQFTSMFPFGPSLTSSRNQIHLAPARLNYWLLHSVHPHFKLPLTINIYREREFETRINSV